MKQMVVAEYRFRTTAGEYWIDVVVDGLPRDSFGPFETLEQRQLAHDDLLAMVRDLGGVDMPLAKQ
jgi:hypothetical protein